MSGPLPQDPGYLPDVVLFGDAMVMGGLCGVLLPLLGVVLVLRQQVFLAAAIGQSANLGAALAMQAAAFLGAGHALDDGLPAYVCGLAAAVLAAVAAMRALSAQATTLEARSAVLFLGGGAGAMLLLAHAPHGVQMLERRQFSSLLTVGTGDLVVAASLLVVVWITMQRCRHRLWLWALDPRAAAAHGASLRRWDLAVGAVLGLGLGHALHGTGLVFTFGLTVLPVLAAREVAGSLRQVLVLAPLFGVAAVVSGFVFGHRFDLPVGQVATAAAALPPLLLFGVMRRWRRN